MVCTEYLLLFYTLREITYQASTTVTKKGVTKAKLLLCFDVVITKVPFSPCLFAVLLFRVMKTANGYTCS